MKEYARKIEAASNVLVVGAGSTGIETIGELVHEFPQKKIAVIQRNNNVLTYLPEAAQKHAKEFLEENKVKMFLGESFDDEFLKKNPYDIVIKTSGFKYRTDYMQQQFKDCLNVHNQIQVNRHLQVTN